MVSVILPPNAPLVGANGLVDPTWYRYFVNIQKRIEAEEANIDADQILSGGSFAGAYDDLSGAVQEALLGAGSGSSVDLAALAQEALLGFAPVAFSNEQDILIPPFQESDPFDVTTTYRAAPVTVATDAAFNITPSVTGVTVRHTGTLTADRLATLVTTGARAGSQTQVVRTGAGAFNLSVGGLKNLATNTWALVEYSGSAWFLAGYGAL